ncbi:hypothetical protein IEO21_02593 [Rhodonia placenta]|uniref:Uncharacterized protein n=1 Tax=Rhodonia placenta TaxID=104341 RepID=A0A8H7U464_9APHY|nr:hypothetical protein IEO21_02593 [Postia placenta]
MSLSEAIPQEIHQANSQRLKEAQVFEFTKRKRWADLLVTELSEAIILVLSATCQVWYCGAAVTELLGWKDEDLVDVDLTDFMNTDDRVTFRSMVRECIQSKQSLLAYSRLQCKNDFYMASDYSSRPREVLFEITGHSHFLPDTGEFRCFFAMAKPYPSRNTAMLNTFLELKMENERLQQRLVRLRAQNSALDATAGGQTLQNQSPGQETVHGQQVGEGYYGSYEEMVPDSITAMSRTNYDGSELAIYTEHPTGDDDGSERGGPKKKRSFGGTAEQYVCVTCGRTDSPEWRKGPLGPKTLCNACGLRWAKKVRTDKSGQVESDGSASGLGSVVF